VDPCIIPNSVVKVDSVVAYTELRDDFPENAEKFVLISAFDEDKRKIGYGLLRVNAMVSPIGTVGTFVGAPGFGCSR
jgi:hypothetical protein